MWKRFGSFFNTLIYCHVPSPSLYSTGKYTSGEHYGWIRYDSVQLNLKDFGKRNLGRFTPPKKCPS
jgi:hypothetical protein